MGTELKGTSEPETIGLTTGDRGFGQPRGPFTGRLLRAEDTPLLQEERQGCLRLLADLVPPARRPDVAAALKECLISYRDKFVSLERGSIERITCRLGEKHQARSSWLYIAEESVLKVIATNGPTQKKGRRVPIRGHGIVPRVARTREGYCQGDCRENRDPYYTEFVSETCSEQAVPIIFGGELLGVLNQESPTPGAFSPISLKILEQDAMEWIPHLVTLKSLTSASNQCAPLWNPDNLGWNSSKLFELLVQGLKSTLNRLSEAIHVVVWYIDPLDNFAWALGCTGYGSEFMGHQTLPNTSFSYQMGDKPQGTVQDTGSKDKRLARAEVNDSMGLLKVRAVTVRTCDRDPKKPRAGIVLSFYAFDGKAVEALPGEDELQEIAQLLACQSAGYLELRPKLAVATILNSLRECQDADDILPRVVKETEKILLAQAATILGRPPGSEKVHVLASTTALQHYGLKLQDRPAPSTRADTLDFISHSVNDGSITGAMLGLLNKSIRFNKRVSEQDLNALGLPSNPIPLLREKLSKGTGNIRKFLGQCVSGKDGQKPLGVFRVIRPDDHPPFTLSDCEVLDSIVKVCPDPLGSWRDWYSHVNSNRENLVLKQRLQHPLPRFAGCSMQAIIREVLIDSCELTKEQTGDHILHVALLTERTNNNSQPVETSVYYSELRGYTPLATDKYSPTHFPLAAGSAISNWKDLLDRGQPITFSNPGNLAKCGVIIPFRVWCGQHSTRCALSVEFSQPLEIGYKLTADLQLAARKITAILTLASSTNPKHWISPKASSEEFASNVAKSINATGLRLQISVNGLANSQDYYDNDPAILGNLDLSDPSDWIDPLIYSERHNADFPDHDAIRWGVKEKMTDEAVLLKIPLRFGNDVIGEVIAAWSYDANAQACAQLDNDLALLQSRRIQTILAFWTVWSWSWGSSNDFPFLVNFKRYPLSDNVVEWTSSYSRPSANPASQTSNKWKWSHGYSKFITCP